MDLCVWELCWPSNSHRNEIIWINETQREQNGTLYVLSAVKKFTL